MTSINRKRVFSTAAVVAICASAVSAKVMEDTAAVVNGQPILMSEYGKNKESILEQYKKNIPDFFQQKDAVAQLEQKVLDQMIDDALLFQQAEKMKIKIRERELETGIKEIKKRFQVDESGKPLNEDEAENIFQRELRKEGVGMEQFRERIKRQLMIRKAIEETVRPRIQAPEDKEVRSYFEKINYLVKGDTSSLAGMADEDAQDLLGLSQRFKDLVSERIRVRHILIKVDEKASIVDKSAQLKKAQDIKKALDADGDFAELAKKNSDDAESAQRGGDIGFIIRGWMVPEFEKAAFALGVGETCEPVETKFGFHIIRVEEKKAAQKLNYDEVKEDLAQYVGGRQMQKELLALIKDLRSKASIQITAQKKTN